MTLYELWHGDRMVARVKSPEALEAAVRLLGPGKVFETSFQPWES